MHGFVPWAGREGERSEKSPGASEWKGKIRKNKKNAQEALEKARESNEERI